jgi:hypothetical protein
MLLTIRLSHLSSLLADRKRRAITSALSPSNQSRRHATPYLSKLDSCRSAKASIRLLALSLSLAVAAPALFAQDWDHDNGRDRDHDPTGAWLIRNDTKGSPFILTVFHKGGTLTGDIQGENAFDPAATKPPTSPANVINSPESGVWQKTGWNTFAVTLLTIEYEVDPPNATLFQFDKTQFVGFRQITILSRMTPEKA